MIAGLFGFFIILIVVDEHHDVGVLLDGAGFAQVTELRAFVFAAFDLTGQLREGRDGDVQFLGDGLQALGDLGHFLHAVLLGGAFQKLEVVDDQHIQTLGPFQAAGAASFCGH